MAQRVLLHLGTMKSGTSFVQNVLGENKERLAAQDVLFPGERWRQQVRAVRELIGHGGPGQPAMPTDGPWQQLVDEVRAWPGTAVVSMEFLGPRTAEQIRRIRSAFEPARVEAVMTCRDLGRNVPAMWLESVQNGGTTGWEDYLAALAAPERSAPAAKAFWRHQDVPAIAARWAKGLGSDALTLVTVPAPGAPADELWRRFTEVLGLVPTAVELDVRSNPGVDLPSALVLLHLNRRFRPDGTGALPPYYDKLVKHQLSKRGLSLTPSRGKLGFDAEWARRAGAEQVRALRGAGYRVVGDLDDLLPVPVRGDQPGDVSAEQVLDTAVEALELVLSRWHGGKAKGRRPETLS